MSVHAPLRTLRNAKKDGSRIKRITRIARMKGENQPHKNVGRGPCARPKMQEVCRGDAPVLARRYKMQK